MKRFVLAIALVCAISATALAGEVPTTGVVEPGDVETPGLTSTGDVPSTGVSVLLAILDLAF